MGLDPDLTGFGMEEIDDLLARAEGMLKSPKQLHGYVVPGSPGAHCSLSVEVDPIGTALGPTEIREASLLPRSTGPTLEGRAWVQLLP